MPAPKPKVKVPCSNCGEILERHPYRIDYAKNQFCNPRCHGEWRSKTQRGKNHPRWNENLDVTCDQCGEGFHQRGETRLERNEHNFCSSECSVQWHKDNGTYAGKNNPAWKPPVIKPCDNCGKTIKRYPSKVGKDKRTRHFCNAECRSEWISIHMSGENSPNWKGGPEAYDNIDYGPNWKRQRRRALRRDGYRCQHCGISKKKIGRNPDVHHIIPFSSFGYIRGENDNCKQANRLSNLISLCPGCHKRAEWGHIPVQPKLL